MAKKPPRKQKHIPQRMCVACRERYDKRRLTRIVNSPQEGVIVDLSGKKNGRGAYLCDQMKCWDMALNNAALLNQALKTEVTPQEREKLSEYKPAAKQVME
ncbi:MAG: RNase P modulator RnpM [Candidatus Promineifilaceae bacterium]